MAAASFVLLSSALRALSLGTASATWTGIGALGAFALGIAAMGEPASGLRLGSAALILFCLLGLKLGAGG